MQFIIGGLKWAKKKKVRKSRKPIRKNQVMRVMTVAVAMWLIAAGVMLTPAAVHPA